MPEDDQGYMLMVAQLPAGASMQRTEQVLEKIRAVILEQPEVESMLAITGLNLLAQVNTPYTGSGFIPLKPWSQRPGRHSSAQALIERLYRLSRAAQGGQCRAGGAAGDPRHRPGRGLRVHARGHLGRKSGKFHRARSTTSWRRPSKRKELARVSTQFNDRVPEIEYVIDRDRARELGIPISDIFGALQTFLGGNYINDFNLVRAHIPGHGRGRGRRRERCPTPSTPCTCARRRATWCRCPRWSPSNRRTGPAYIERYNVFRAVTINGAPAPGYSQGDAITAME